MSHKFFYIFIFSVLLCEVYILNQQHDKKAQPAVIIAKKLKKAKKQPIKKRPKVAKRKPASIKVKVDRHLKKMALRGRANAFRPKPFSLRLLPTLPSKRTFAVNERGQQFVLLPNVFPQKIAKKYEDFPRAKVLLTKFGHRFVTSSDDEELNETLPFAVYNKQTKQVGLLTGVFKVKFNDLQAVEDIIENLPVLHQKTVEHLRLAFFKSMSDDNLPAILKKIKGTKGVTKATLEILEHVVVPL
ncbi:MAG: hypothetical protein ISR65_07240 [Bacteriovoracaceae bacterium]|nr:hypothetical protein [Bacteriovoracaceae bacterium]